MMDASYRYTPKRPIPKDWRAADKLSKPVHPYDEQPPDWCLPVEEDEPAAWWEWVLLGVCFGAGIAAAIALGWFDVLGRLA